MILTRTILRFSFGVHFKWDSRNPNFVFVFYYSKYRLKCWDNPWNSFFLATSKWIDEMNSLGLNCQDFSPFSSSSSEKCKMNMSLANIYAARIKNERKNAISFVSRSPRLLGTEPEYIIRTRTVRAYELLPTYVSMTKSGLKDCHRNSWQENEGENVLRTRTDLCKFYLNHAPAQGLNLPIPFSILRHIRESTLIKVRGLTFHHTREGSRELFQRCQCQRMYTR